MTDNRPSPAAPGLPPGSEYVTQRNVPIFAEHEITTSKGRVLRFGRRELEQIAARCNQRIAESGDYAALTLGHTPTDEQLGAGVRQPEVVGFAGPFRVGQIGDGQKRRYAILADFHVFKEDAAKLKKHPRRSPELIVEDSYAEMFLDPIALLGAETPKLDMGLCYSSLRQGVEVERYAAVAPAAAAVFVPAHEPTRPKRYQADSAPAPTVEPPMDGMQDAGSKPVTATIAEIIDALEQTDVFQWVKQQMEQEAGANATASQPEPAPEPPPDDPVAAMAAAPPGMDAGGPPDGMAPDDGMPPDEAPPAAAAGDEPPPSDDAGDEDDDQKYACGPGGSPMSADRRRYSADPAVEARIVALEKANATLTEQLNAERELRVNAQRRTRLAGLRQRFAFDLSKEVERTRYGRMEDPAFKEHCELIEANYREIPLGVDLPTDDEAVAHEPSRPGRGAARERYSREAREKALEKAKQLRAEGNKSEHLYETCLAEAANGKA